MKKFLAAALLFMVVAAPVFAADSGVYAGITVGGAKADNPYTGTTTTKDNDTVAGMLLGYQFTRNWGVEAFYTGAGKLETSCGAGCTGSVKADALGINAVGTAPIFDAFSLYAKLGYANAKTDASSNPVQLAGDTRGSVTGGLGAQYNISRDVGIRFGWDTYDLATKSGNTVGLQDKFKSNVWLLGAVFKF